MRMSHAETGPHTDRAHYGKNVLTITAGGFSAYIDLLALECHPWGNLIHALSIFGYKTAVDAVRTRLRMGEYATLSDNEPARLVLPETFLTHVRKAAEVTHATLLRDPRTLTPSDFLVITRSGEDPARRFYRMCDALITTPLHPAWAPWLWRWAQRSEVLEKMECYGGEAFKCRVEEERLEKALSRALKAGEITIPASDVKVPSSAEQRATTVVLTLPSAAPEPATSPPDQPDKEVLPLPKQRRFPTVPPPDQPHTSLANTGYVPIRGAISE